MVEPIPAPKGLPFIGNLLDLQDEVPIHAVARLIDIYGPIVSFDVLGQKRIIIANFELFDEVCDETRFWKLPPAAFGKGGGEARGLFTAFSEKDDDWLQAHRILMPAFGPLAIEQMFDEMHDIASQLVLKWARKGKEYKIPVANDMSRLTLDTIALCAMDYRFNSFYQDEMHPFVQAMTNMLSDRMKRNQLSYIVTSFFSSAAAEQVKKDIKYQKDVSASIVQHRRENPTEKKDLLNALIYGKDPKTGQSMRDELIMANMQTFLIAGHETTSGLLSFALAFLLKSPSAYLAVREEVDRVVGKDKIAPKHLNELNYINAVLRETLRLCPVAPMIQRGIRPENKEETTLIGGKYAIPRGQGIGCLLSKIHRDPKIYGEDAEEFKPERMLDENFDKLPKNAWKPFGTGLRACIGRTFAWQESLLAMALIFQNFDLSLDDPQYEMKILQTLTIKPKDFYMRASLRTGIDATHLQERLSSYTSALASKLEINTGSAPNSTTLNPMTIFYGSNTGTCQAFAQKLTAQARQNGYNATVKDLDDAIGSLPKDGPVVVITASYEGQPPDNAARFVAWLEQLNDEKAFNGVNYAVFGCGHRDWTATYQRIPKLVDASFAKLGATRIADRGESDASQRDMSGDFDSWTEKTIWPAILKGGVKKQAENVIEPLPDVELDIVTEKRAAHLQQSLQWGKVLATKPLTKPGHSEKHHIEIQLPSEMSYQIGDYLAVLPLNPEESVKRVTQKFQLPWDSIVTIKDNGATILPKDSPLSISELLRGYVELSDLVSRKNISLLLEHATEATEKEAMKKLLDSEVYMKEVVDRRISLLDLLDKYPSVSIAFSQFLAMLPSLKVRQYSISSSPLKNPGKLSLTYSVIDEPALSGSGQQFHGVTSTYLRSLKAGDEVLISVRSTNKFFRLPVDQESTPIVMFCAGSGIAPFRGFCEERAFLIQEGKRKLSKAVLFVGCRGPELDQLYPEEFAEWQKIGAVDVRYAFSRDPENSAGCKHIQDRVIKDKDELYSLWNEGAKLYICGSRDVSHELGKAARVIVKDGAALHGKDMSPEELDQWLKDKRNERIVSDVFQ